MKTLLIRLQFIAGPLIGHIIKEEIITNFPKLWATGTERIDYITETPFIILYSREV